MAVEKKKFKLTKKILMLIFSKYNIVCGIIILVLGTRNMCSTHIILKKFYKQIIKSLIV